MIRGVKLTLEGAIIGSLLLGGLCIAIVVLFNYVASVVLVCAVTVVIDRMYLKKKGRLYDEAKQGHYIEGRSSLSKD